MVCATTNSGAYAFQCPTCRLAVSKATDARVVDVLVASGATLAVWRAPAELSEAHFGPPISYDDVLAFHFDLQRSDCLAELCGEDRQLQTSASEE